MPTPAAAQSQQANKVDARSTDALADSSALLNRLWLRSGQVSGSLRAVQSTLATVLCSVVVLPAAGEALRDLFASN